MESRRSPLSRWTAEQVQGGGWIRRMFAEGERLRAQHGDDAVIDLSLGQPLEPPAVVRQALEEAARERFAGRHMYMPNLGYEEVRERAAAEVGSGMGVDSIAMTGGAAGAMCLALRAFVDSGQEVLGMAPFFPEFAPYCETSGLSFRPVHVREDQGIDIDGVVRALTERTAAVILNSPSNPTGHVVDGDEMAALVDVLEHHNRRTSRRILLIVDEAYRKLVYPPAQRVDPFLHYDNTVLARSFSKDMGLAGERIGYLALHPSMAGPEVSRGLSSCMRALGMVNAPATMQRLLLALPSWDVDVQPYRRLRDRALRAARDAGLDVAEPQGGIFLWVRSPWENTLDYVEALARRRVLVSPGVAFASPRFVRMCFTTSEAKLDEGLAVAGEVARAHEAHERVR
ncbi:MAG: aminotransferase class I/II-fold pyridoxal phosphate-dependent enzyme [Candidatus Dormibacteria bacterium]